MPIFTLIFVLVVIGVVLWAVTTYIPMNPSIKKILIIAVVVAVVLWLASVFGLIPSGANIRVGR
jgi:hypothetical protein